MLSNQLPPRRGVNRQSSVILPLTGQRVHRSISNTSHESTPLLRSPKVVLSPIWNLLNDRQFQSVIKCSLAYLIASLGVYYTRFDEFLGHTDSKHIVATVAVYFHPARSKGQMHQTLIHVVISLLFSFSVSMVCRLISTIFFNIGEDEISHAIDLLISSILLGFVAMMKQSYPHANTACSLASICIVACIVKEGSLNSASIPFERISLTFQVAFTGCFISGLVCYVVWPISAVDELQSSLNDSYNIMSSIISMITSRFLNGQHMREKDDALFAELRSNIAQLLKNTEEAKFELNLKGREEEWHVFDELVKLTIGLSRHLQALRTSTEMQAKLLAGVVDSELSSLESWASDTDTTNCADVTYDSIVSSLHNHERLVEVEEDDAPLEFHPNPVTNEHAHIFDLFVDHLAPSTKSLVFTIKGILSQVPFENFNPISNKFVETTHLQSSLSDAIKLYEQKQLESFEILYSQEVFKKADFLLKTDQEEVTACCGNFSSILSLYALGLLEFLKLAGTYEDAKANPRSWSWLKIWKLPESKAHESFQRNHSTLDAALLEFQSQYREMPKQSTATFRFNVWKALKVFRRTDVKFGIRVGLGALVLSSFAFLPRSKEYFINWRIEWALAVYCIMMNKSVGGTTMTVKWRFIGTFAGAYLAYLIWILTDGNAYALAATGFLISIPSFYIILFWKKNNPFGRFILLTYNLTALYSYSMTQLDSEDGGEGGDDPIIGEIAFHRVFAVSVGIIWALIMAQCFLPSSARSRLKSGLTILWLRLGVIWNSDPLDYDPESFALIGLKDEKGVNGLLAECETLLKHAPVEFRLKGSFPEASYKKLLNSTSTIINAFQNMNLMIQIDPVLNHNEEQVLKYIESERNEFEHRIFLMFYMIASAMRLGFPIPRKPASTEHAKDRLLYKLSELRDKDVALTNNDFILLYSYILVTSEITEQLDVIIEELSEMLGDVSVEVLELV